MNADAFRHFYNYHFSENRQIWDSHIAPLPQDQFVQQVDYSVGSVRNHIVHMMSVDEVWFCDLRGIEIPSPLNLAHLDERREIRSYWDRVEAEMREYLSSLRDDMLFDKPLSGEDKDLFLWQVLLHVVNHGTDHRAQVLRVLNDLGVKTTAQDYVFYVYDNP
jgi:uncharacterized damage-inducible protein DinB